MITSVRTLRGKLWWIVLSLAIVGLVVYAFLPARVEVDAAAVTRGSLRVTVDREGKTRVRERYVVSAPLAGRLLRSQLHPGDRVEEHKTVVAAIEPGDPSLLDARARAEAEARVRAAEESSKLAEANLRHARTEYERAQRLASRHLIAEEELERFEHNHRAASFSARIAAFELEQAKAALLRTRPRSPGEEGDARLDIRSPITGRVLEVYQESSRIISVGTELLKLGNTSDLECVIDVLSTDAVKIRQGATVYLEHWGDDRPLLGRVRLVEPAAFTKVSALGVEEQRVNVLVDFTEPPSRWQTLGDAYRVEARIVIWEGNDVLKAPAGALFRSGDGWAVFRIVQARAQLTAVAVGRSNGLETEILEGLQEGDLVILHPSDRIQEGVSVAPR